MRKRSTGNNAASANSHLSNLDLNRLSRRDLVTFPVSSFSIQWPAKAATREPREAANAVIDRFNQMVYKYKELPKDESFARVIVALRKLKQFQQAEDLFSLLNGQANPAIKEQIVGAYTYSAMLEVFRDQLQKTDEATKNKILHSVQQLWESCRERGFVRDPYIITNMMCIYSALEDYSKVIEIFSTYQTSVNPDLTLYGKYVKALIHLNRLDEAITFLATMKTDYQKSKKTSKDIEAIRSVYNMLISRFFDVCIQKAHELFEDAVNIGIYANNRPKKEDNKIVLDLHISSEYKQREGGLPLVVAKVAFSYLLRQIEEKEIHIDVRVITGGHNNDHATLKRELPNYLKELYDIDTIWNENPKLLEFTIAYPQLRKVRFLANIKSYREHYPENASIDQSTLTELKRRYRADLRRSNEQRSDKYFSEQPLIPDDFGVVATKLAKDGISSYNVFDYGAAERYYRELIDLVPYHPWPYLQLGWILHRTEQFDEAIYAYAQAAEHAGQNTLLSEIYRKIGWAHDRKHRKSKTKEDLAKAFEYYEKSIALNPGNFEVYNNWGIGLERTERYEDAIEKFAIVRRNCPQHDEACVHLGNCYKHLNDYEQAERYYQEAIERSKEHDDGRSAAWAYCELGDLYCQQYQRKPSEILFQKARREFEKSLELQPTRDQANKGLSCLYKLKGNDEKSHDYLRKIDYLIFSHRKAPKPVPIPPMTANPSSYFQQAAAPLSMAASAGAIHEKTHERTLEEPEELEKHTL